MNQNVLFNFIRSNPVDLGSKIKSPTLAKSSKGQLYFRFELENSDEIIIHGEKDQYFLTDHHVSIYETENKANPYLSELHYTAYFMNRAEERFQLHVYLNHYDELTVEPVFSIASSPAGSYTPFPQKGLSFSFFNLTKRFAIPLITGLRKSHADKVIELEQEYLELESQAETLSESSTFKSKAYFDKLDAICQKLDQLIPLVSNSEYQKIRHFILKMKTALQKQLADTKSEETKYVRESLEEEPSVTIIKNNDLVPSPENSVIKINQLLKKTSKFERELKDLLLEFNSLREATDEIKALLISKVLNKTYELSLTLEEESEISPGMLEELQKIRLETQQLAQKLLPRLIFTNHFEAAKHLSSAHYLMKEKYVNLALQTRNHKLLDFVLTYGSYDLKQPVFVKEKHFSSAVKCCFSLDKEDYSMKDCLSVLIKHGASLWERAENGLPFASILLAPSHPLRPALSSNRENTLDSSYFYKQLEQSLSLCLHERDWNEEEKNQLRNQIELATLRAESLAVNYGGRFDGFYKKRVGDFQEKYHTPLILKLKEDPAIAPLFREYEANQLVLFKKLTEKQRLLSKKKFSHIFDNLSQTLDNADSIDYDFLRATTISFLQEAIKLSQKYCVVTDLQNELNRVNPSKKASRATKKKYQEYQTLVAEIKTIEEKYHFLPDSKEKTGSKLAVKNSLDSLQQLSQSLESFQKLSDKAALFLHLSSTFFPPNYEETLTPEEIEEKSRCFLKYVGLGDLEEETKDLEEGTKPPL